MGRCQGRYCGVGLNEIFKDKINHSSKGSTIINLAVNPHKIIRNGRKIKLGPKEFKLLRKGCDLHPSTSISFETYERFFRLKSKL